MSEMNEMNEKIENSSEVKPEEQEKLQKMSDCADLIREAAKKEKYVTFSSLCAALSMEVPAVEALLNEMKGSEGYTDICFYQGEKDKYYYSYPTLAHNYVKNVALAEEDNITHTIADIVRYESKTYPRATTYDTFAKFPYHYTVIQVRNAVAQMQKMDAYKDIQIYESQQKHMYLYSTLYLTPDYAACLVERAEDITLWQ